MGDPFLSRRRTRSFMRSSSAEVVLILMLGLCAAAAIAGVSGADSAVAPDHILVKFKPSAAAKMKAAALNEGLDELVTALALPPGASLSEPAVNQVLREQRHLQPDTAHAKVYLDRFLYLLLPPSLSVDECVKRAERHPWI